MQPGPPRRRHRNLLLPAIVMLALALSVGSIYRQVEDFSFVNVDDGLYVGDNPPVRGGLTREGVSWAFTTFHASNWHPLTWLSHMIDASLFGASPGWHHRMNAIYHLAGTELLFLVLWRMTGSLWPSAFAAALFGVHPLQVESVAWVSERKNLLSAIFLLLTVWAYVRYVRRPRIGRYLPVAILFLAGLLSKPMLVTLPFALLLLDWWPLSRSAPSRPAVAPPPAFRSAIPGLLAEKVPLLLLSAASSAVTVLAQARGRSVTDLQALPLGARFSEAAVAYGAYLKKAVWPSSLAVMYPHPASLRMERSPWEVAAGLLLVGLATAAVLWRRERRPWFVVGWFWFLGTLVPVLGLIQVGSAAMADRYMYIPSIGLFVAVAWGASRSVPRRRSGRIALSVSGAAALAALSVAAWNQAAYWRDSVTLWSRAAAVTDRNWVALGSLGNAWLDLGQQERAIALLRQSLEIMPENPIAWNNLGMAYSTRGLLEQAIRSYRYAVEIKPDHVKAWNNLGTALTAAGRDAQAVEAFRRSVAAQPNQAVAWSNLVRLHAKAGQREEMFEAYERLRATDSSEAERLAGLVDLGR